MIYLDNAATTYPSKEALDAFLQEAALGANPSSLHAAGFDAHCRLEEYRRRIAETLGAKNEELLFTSGGTESANLALFGAARARKRRGKRILLSDAEHPAVAESVKALEAEGFEIVKIPTRGGRLDLEAIRQAADDSVILAAFMHVNNETGAVFEVADAFRLVKAASPSAVTFADCVQSYLKVPFTADSLGADLLSLSAHKIHGVRGVGALYVRRNTRLVSPICGGGQEQGLRSGTENAPGIAAFAAAASAGFAALDERIAHLASLQTRLGEGLSALKGVLVLSGFPRSPHVVSATFSDYKSEVLLHLLSDRGVCVSSGSACSSKKGAKSPVLLAHGLSARDADATLRFSLCDTTEKSDVDSCLAALNSILTEGRYSR